VSAFLPLAWLGWFLVALSAWLFRGRVYGIFRAVTIGLQLLILGGLVRYFAWALPALAYLQLTVFASALVTIRPKLQPLYFRALVSIPAAFFSAGSLLAWPWAIAAALGLTPHGAWIPFVLAGIGIVQSLTAREEARDVVVGDGLNVEGLRRHAAGTQRVARPLRLVQITDPHLGPFMSVKRLKRIAERAVKRSPDIILLTGDFLTMESQSTPELLAEALSPLRELSGRTFACLGNHDHETLGLVRQALRDAGVKLLVDEATVVDTPAGKVQIVGFDFVWRERAEHLARVTAENPRLPGVMRLLLLHDPGAFKHLPAGEGDLVLSGHTHGGQVGLVSLGLPWTAMRAFVSAPDHGLWARGVDRLYVHRGTGHYGFPLRLGVPSEESLLNVHLVPAPSPA
jgi:predicted MPP superfamily phosphohydrolase